MATQSRIVGTEEAGRLKSMGLQSRMWLWLSNTDRWFCQHSMSPHCQHPAESPSALAGCPAAALACFQTVLDTAARTNLVRYIRWCYLCSKHCSPSSGSTRQSPCKTLVLSLSHTDHLSVRLPFPLPVRSFLFLELAKYALACVVGYSCSLCILPAKCLVNAVYSWVPLNLTFL